MLEIKSLVDTRKLIKGGVYKTDYITDYNLSVYTLSGEYVGYYLKCSFTNLNGKEIKHSKYDVRTVSKDPKVGDIVVCNTNRNYKYLVKGGKYRIEEVTKGYWGATKVKFQGYKRYLTWSSYNFRKMSTQEQRDVLLDQIFDKEENFSVEFIRKFEQSSSKEKDLIEAISRSIIDKHRHKLNIVDWAVQKSSKHMGLKSEDFNDLLEMKLSDILKLIEDN